MAALRFLSPSVSRMTRVSKRHVLGAGLALPFTILVLFFLALFNVRGWVAEVLGLLAVFFGVIGTLAFFAFMYQYYLEKRNARMERRALLAIHILAIGLLYLLIQWLGFFSPWCHLEIWGSYDIQTASRSWIIAVLSIGTITLVGCLVNGYRMNREEDPQGGETSSPLHTRRDETSHT